MTAGPSPDTDWRALLLQSIQAGPPGAAQQDNRQPIGVPPGYVATKKGQPTREFTDQAGRIPGGAARTDTGVVTLPGQDVLIPPTFYDGDEYLPAQLSAEDRARLQMKMYELGILDQDFQVGVWDGPSRLAYRSVLEFANGAGITDPQTAMDQYGNLLDASKSPRNRAPLVIRETNPADIRAVVADAAGQILGHKADDAQVDRIVNAYHAAEADYQTQAWDATYDSGTVVEPPTLQTFAKDRLEEANPTEAGAYAVADRVVNDFMGLVGGPFGGG